MNYHHNLRRLGDEKALSLFLQPMNSSVQDELDLVNAERKVNRIQSTSLPGISPEMRKTKKSKIKDILGAPLTGSPTVRQKGDVIRTDSCLLTGLIPKVSSRKGERGRRIVSNPPKPPKLKRVLRTDPFHLKIK